MAFIVTLTAVAAFLSGSAIGILAILAAGIRSDDRAKNLTSAPRTGTEAVTRHVLGVGVRMSQADHTRTASSDQPMPPGDRSSRSLPGSDLT
jgi:hypothetical protein